MPPRAGIASPLGSAAEGISFGSSRCAGSAWKRAASLARIEQRLADIPATSEQRVSILRDAMADFTAAELARRDEEIALLKEQVADLTHRLDQKMVVDQQVHEIATRLEERQAQRDTPKNGITDGDFMQTMSMVITQERQSARNEFKTADEEMQRALEAKLAAVEERLKSVPGRLPVAKIWRPESVTYQGEFVCHEGALKASQDTAQIPGGADWVASHAPVATALTGERRQSAAHTMRTKKQKYAQLDIVTRAEREPGYLRRAGVGTVGPLHISGRARK
jgi:hypothetical protein